MADIKPADRFILELDKLGPHPYHLAFRELETVAKRLDLTPRRAHTLAAQLVARGMVEVPKNIEPAEAQTVRLSRDGRAHARSLRS